MKAKITQLQKNLFTAIHQPVKSTECMKCYTSDGGETYQGSCGHSGQADQHQGLVQ